MKPSKENCRLAMAAFQKVKLNTAGVGDLLFIGEFLAVALRRMPSEATIDRNRIRLKDRTPAVKA